MIVDVANDINVDHDIDLTCFVGDVTDTWIESQRSYDIALWNHFGIVDEPKTNNNVEGYNLKLDRFQGPHSNKWKWVRDIRDEETRTAIRYHKLEDGTLVERVRNKKDLERDLKISTLTNKYLLEEIDLIEYWQRLSDVVPELNK